MANPFLGEEAKRFLIAKRTAFKAQGASPFRK
jgi:hypothetical protein